MLIEAIAKIVNTLSFGLKMWLTNRGSFKVMTKKSIVDMYENEVVVKGFVDMLVLFVVEVAKKW